MHLAWGWPLCSTGACRPTAAAVHGKQHRVPAPPAACLACITPSLSAEAQVATRFCPTNHLQRGLAQMIGRSSGFVESLPVPVRADACVCGSDVLMCMERCLLLWSRCPCRCVPLHARVPNGLGGMEGERRGTRPAELAPGLPLFHLQIQTRIEYLKEPHSNLCLNSSLADSSDASSFPILFKTADPDSH